MSDPDLVAKKLAFIETCVRELREMSRPEHIAANVREDRFVAHSLQIAIQGALDVASHIVSDQRLGKRKPRTCRHLMELLADAGGGYRKNLLKRWWRWWDFATLSSTAMRWST